MKIDQKPIWLLMDRVEIGIDAPTQMLEINGT